LTVRGDEGTLAHTLQTAGGQAAGSENGFLDQSVAKFAGQRGRRYLSFGTIIFLHRQFIINVWLLQKRFKRSRGVSTKLLIIDEVFPAFRLRHTPATMRVEVWITIPGTVMDKMPRFLTPMADVAFRRIA